MKNYIKIVKNWKTCILNTKSTIKEAILNLQNSGFRIILVVDKSFKLVGTITDGDIRRGLLIGLKLSDKIEKILKKNFFYINQKDKVLNIPQFMKKFDVLQIPIIDNKKKIVGLHLWNEQKNTKRINNTMFILAGGMGTRMRPLTTKIPKPMLPINEKPILDHIINNAKLYGIFNFIISVNYLSHTIINYFGDGKKLDINITYVHEKIPMGTIGSISLINKIPKKSLFVMNGDIISNINFKNFLDYHKKNMSLASMGVRIIESREPFGVVKTKGMAITGFEEKPIKKMYINSGIYIIEPYVINYINKYLIKNKSLDMPNLFKIIRKEKKKSLIFPFFESWVDIGIKSDYEKIKNQNIII